MTFRWVVPLCVIVIVVGDRLMFRLWAFGCLVSSDSRTVLALALRLSIDCYARLSVVVISALALGCGLSALWAILNSRC